MKIYVNDCLSSLAECNEAEDLRTSVRYVAELAFGDSRT